jgi:hypothetical protein
MTGRGRGRGRGRGGAAGGGKKEKKEGVKNSPKKKAGGKGKAKNTPQDPDPQREEEVPGPDSPPPPEFQDDDDQGHEGFPEEGDDGGQTVQVVPKIDGAMIEGPENAWPADKQQSEEKITDFYADRPYYYDKTHPSYKDTTKKVTELTELAAELQTTRRFLAKYFFLEIVSFS